MEIIFLVVTIIFFASLTRSTFGFGDALLAMPLFALFLSIQVTTPLVALMGVAISVIIAVKEWRHIKISAILPLAIPSIVGIPLGLYLLQGIHDQISKIILAIILIGFSTYKLVHPNMFRLTSDRLAPLFGFIGGIVGGAYNTNGPIIVIYGTLRNWEPKIFRANLQAYFLPAGILICTGHAISGMWTSQVITSFLTGLPMVVLGIFLGGHLNKKIPKDHFDKFIYLFLIAIGILLLIKNIE